MARIARTLRRATELAFEALPLSLRARLTSVTLERLDETVYLRMASRGFQPQTILDIGAYHGNWSKKARAIWPRAQIYMFEAQPNKRRILEQAARDLNAQYFSVLLAEKDDVSAKFFIMETGSSMFAENSTISRGETYLRTTTLDTVIAADELATPIFIKIDVQGAELAVLKGAPTILEKASIVQLEVPLLEYNIGAPRFEEVVNFMATKGFVISDISGFGRPQGLDLVQIDCIFKSSIV